MSKGRHVAAGNGGWQKNGDPFSEGAPKTNEAPKTDDTADGGKWPTWKKVLAIGGGCILLLAVVVAVAWKMLVKQPDVSANDRPGVVNTNPHISTENSSGNENNTPDVITGRKEDYYTFLLIGRDTAGGGNTDTMILVSYDVPNGQVNMMSLPRDTAVNVPWTIKKLNSVYNAKESSGGGLEGLKKQVAYLTGVLPDFYVVIEWKAVGEIVDAVKGVEFDVPRNMNYDDDYQNLHIHLNKGLQTLSGQQAMNMLRYRNDNGKKAGYNDIGRMNTQRDFLKAMAKKVLKLGNITKITDFIKIFMDNVTTDLSLTDLVWFATNALNVDTDTIQSSTMPYIDVGYFHGGDYLMPDGEEIVTLVNEQFNPYNQEIRLSDLQILVRNKDGSCSVTSGELLATGWAKATSSGSSGTKGGGVTTTEPTGVTANPVTNTGTSQAQTSTGSSSGQTQTTRPNTGANTSGGGSANTPSTTTRPSGTTTTEPGDTDDGPGDDPAVQPNDDGPLLPGETDEPQSDPEPEPEAQPEPQPEPEPRPETGPEPEPVPEPELPTPEPESLTEGGDA